MVSLTLFGGVGQIGGNKILVEDGDTRVFFDFGEPFRFLDKYFVDFLKPRDGRFGLRDYFHFDLLPKTPGLYDEEWIADTDLRYVPPEFDAIFISHMHFDHAMHLKFADRSIPVHLGAAANTIRKSWAKTSLGNADFGEHEFCEFRTGQKVKVGSVEVEPVHVDHSTPGAYGFIIHTSEGTLVYTGDLRLHGPRNDMTVEFIERAAEAKPVAMLCEGTRVAPVDNRQNLSEQAVAKKALELVGGTRKLAIVSFYPKDVDRMRTFRDVAKATGRKFVVSAKVAHLMGELSKDDRIDVPDPLKDPSMLVYVRRMAKPEKVPYENEYVKMMGKSDHVVDSSFVRSNQQKLIFHSDFMQLTELIDVAPAPGSLFVRSKSEPFEEDDIQEDVLQNWIAKFGLDFQQAHASGHASMDEIFQLVDRISPKTVVPVHTEHPDMFSRCKCKVRLAEARKKIVL
jgi:ribonuclease J